MVVAITAAVALTGCGGGDSGKKTGAPGAGTSASTSQDAGGGSATVDIVNYKFVQPEVTVKAGSTVTWVNKDDFEHTATAADKKTFDTSTLAKDASGKATFDKPGTYEYICDIHQYMKGKVIVT